MVSPVIDRNHRYGTRWLMSFHLSGPSGCFVVVTVLFVPAALVAWLSNNPKWLVIVPMGIAALALIIAALPLSRKVSPQQWATELERHLLGTDGQWGWDDATSVRLADPRLEALRVRMSKFNSLNDERRREFEVVIAMLKRGEIPEIVDSE